jgi:hypothetical protein
LQVENQRLETQGRALCDQIVSAAEGNRAGRTSARRRLGRRRRLHRLQDPPHRWAPLEALRGGAANRA